MKILTYVSTMFKCFPYALTLFCTLILTACSPGGSNSLSDTGDQQDLAPVAAATALNFSTTIDSDTVFVRSGSQVIVSAKDSDGIDDPLLNFQWDVQQTSLVPAEPISFTQDVSNAIAFMAPMSKVDQTLAVSLTVIDSDGQTDTRILTVNVAGVLDTNNYLVQTVSTQEDFYLELPAATGTYNLTITPVITWQNFDGDTLSSDSYQGSPLDLSRIFSFEQRLSAALDPSAATQIKLAVPLLDIDEINNNPLLAFSDRLELENINTASLTLVFEYADFSGSAATLSLLDQNMISVGSINSAVPLELAVTDLRDNLGIESANSAAAYYNCIDPGNNQLTLQEWITARGFGELGSIAPGNDFAHALYVNNYDLGFGRNMYMRRNGDNVYAYVLNHPSLQATVNKAGAFAVVAMEYADDINCSTGTVNATNKTVKFYAFVPDQTVGGFIRATTMNFDGRGERALPGACTACHGGKSHDLSFSMAGSADLNATFMPWDIDSFLYTTASDTFVDSTYNAENVNPEITALFTRQAQESEFKKLNQMALDTYINEIVEDEANNFDRLIAPISLINGWYGNSNCSSTTDITALINNGCIDISSDANAFDGSFTPAGWLTQNTLYHEVFARNCRMCHTQMEVSNSDNTNNFDSYSKFISKLERIIELAYQEGRMPLARLTADRFWLTPAVIGSSLTAAEILRSHLLSVDPSVTVSTPGQPAPRIAELVEVPVDDQAAGHGRTIALDGQKSIFADSFQWLTTSTCINPQTIATPSDLLTNITTNLTTNEICSVDITLEATDTEYNLVGTKTVTLNLADQAPVANCFTVNASTPNSTINLLTNVSAGDGTNNLPANGFDLVGSSGLGTLTAGGTGEIIYALNNPFNTGTEAFSYRVQDVNATDSITGANCLVIAADTPSLVTVDTTGVGSGVPALNDSPSSATINSITVQWSSSFSGASYDVYRDNVAVATNLSGTSYNDNSPALDSNTSYSYEVEANINSNPSGRSATESYRSLISYQSDSPRDVKSNVVDAIGCIGCHSGGANDHNATFIKNAITNRSCITNADNSMGDCNSSMSSVSISAIQRQLILDWRTDGSPN